MKAGTCLAGAALAAALAVLAAFAGPARASADPIRLDAGAPASGPDDQVGTIKGIAISRPNGGYLGVEIVGGHFRIGFYNAKKKPVPVDVASAVAHWSVHYQPNEERQELLPGDDGVSLTSPMTVKPPLSFTLHLLLFVDGQADPTETYSVGISG